MTTTKSELKPIEIMPGVQPSTDKTALATPHYTMADKIRFRFGYPQKLGGWYSIPLAYSATIAGKARSLFSAVLNTSYNTIIGTNSNLYGLSGSTLTNITPIATASVSIPNSLTNDYGVMFTDPFQFIAARQEMQVLDFTNTITYRAGDVVTFSGATAFAGFTSAQLNGSHTIQKVFAPGLYSIVFPVAATTTAAGGGASVIRSTGNLTVAATSHGLTEGTRIKIAGASTFAGINASQINVEFIIRNPTTNSFDVMTAGTATASASGGGGSGTTYRAQIAAGNENQSVGQGYGMGLYGTGLYGTARQSPSAPSYPRIWIIDRFGSSVILTPGNQGSLYSWDGSTTAAPALVSGAPSAINYAFVSNNIVITFGAGGTPNRIFASDQGSMNQWVASSTNQVFDYTVTGAGRLTSHVPVNAGNLLFTDYQTYLFSYLGFNAGTSVNGIWKIDQLENNIGIIGVMARCSVNGIAYWMGKKNFYRYAGANVEIIPSNSQDSSTILNYVFENINMGQASKCFAWYNAQFDEVWFHYPSASSNEPDRVARYCRSDNSWVPDTFDRICAEYPNLTLGYPRLISSGGTLYTHEQGVDADGQAMPWSLTSNLRSSGKPTGIIGGFIPDSIQTGDISVELTSKLYPQQSTDLYDGTYTVSPDTGQVPVQVGGRFWQYTLSGNAVGQEWTAGQWSEYIQQGPNQ